MIDNLPKRGLLTISMLQGFAFLWLYRRFENELWPANDPTVAWPMLAVLTFLPLLMLLSATRESWRMTLLLSTTYTSVIAVIAGFAGAQSIPLDEVYSINHGFPFALVLWVTTFLAANFIQQRAIVGGAMVYRDLFRFSWRNFLVPTFAALFTLIAFLLLKLWGALFDVLNINFFSYLFAEDWFLFPVLSTVLGIGVITFRDLARIIDSAVQILRGLLRILLPLASFISVIFLLALMTNGASLVWQTGSGSTLMLWLVAVNLFGYNAVYQDGDEVKIYPPLLHRFIILGLLALPIYIGLSGYGLVLRIDQYGLTLARLYGLMVWLIAALFVLGYIKSVITQRDNWVHGLGRTNTLMAGFIVVLLLLTHSPLLELKRVVVWNQLDRLRSGLTTPDAFDVDYLYYHLAQPGRDAIETLKVEYSNDTTFLARLNDPLRIEPGRSNSRLNGHQVDEERPLDDFWQVLETRPTQIDVPLDLRAFIDRRLSRDPFVYSPFLLEVDVNIDGRPDYVFLHMYGDILLRGELYSQSETGEWFASNLRVPFLNRSDVRVFIEHGDIEVVEPAFKDLRVGELIFRVAQREFEDKRSQEPEGP